MGLQVDGKRFLDASANGKATLMTSRRSFVAGWKLCAGATLGLLWAGRSSLAHESNGGDHGHSGEDHGHSGGDHGHSGGDHGHSGEDHGHSGGDSGGGRGHSCFLAGTRIKTPEGEINIEELRIGDNVLTASGETRPIKFIGRRKISRERAARWNGDGPVKILRFAIDGKAPHSDLYVSPAHAIYIDGILIPARYLANGVTIVADARPEALSLTYFHIELNTHEAILAEGLAVESFQRDKPFAFDNAGDYFKLYGSPGEPLAPFAPIVPYGRSQQLASHIRSVLAPVYDLRKPIEKVRDQILDRLEVARAA